VSAAASESMSGETLRCARHPNVETVLRCGRCETPICPRCQIATPVGARCPTCAQVKRFNLTLKPIELAKAIGLGIAVGTIGTLIAGFIGGFLPLLAWMVVGFVVGEAVSVGANRKRAPELGPIAVACVFIGYELGSVLSIALTLQGRIALGPEVFAVPLLQLRQVLLLVGLLVGALLAWMRVR
jgi:hypothetical protein